MSITKNEVSPRTIGLYSFAATWYGHYTYTVNSFYIDLNYRTIIRDAPDDRRWVTSTSSHEMGHIFDLADDPVTSYVSLMKHSRNRTTVYGPQYYDVAEVLRCN